MDKDLVTLTIDNKTVSVPKGTMVVDAAKKADIEIPVFCYHEKLGPFGCCRMCLVEVEKMPKLTTACTLAVAPGMVVKTDTPKVKKGRQGVLEFTLLNHPLDCPVCDKGGECPLQDNTFKYGPGLTRMEFSRAHGDKAAPLSPVITIDRERCIACQRCTRYSDIIEKDAALVMLNRGFHNEVGTFDNRPYDTRFSGNVIDLCPVGALTNTQYRFKSRNWDLENSKTLCAHCGCNCNIVLGSRVNRFMRVQGRPNDAVNEGWICDKGRWGYGFVESGNRILKPRKSGFSAKLSVETACAEAAGELRKIAEQYGPDSVGFIGSPYGTNEELYLYQKLFRTGVGTNNIDHKTYADTPGLPVGHYDFEQAEKANLILLVASDPTEEVPILDLWIKKAVTRLGAKLAVLNDQRTAMDKFACQSLRYNVGSGETAIEALTQVLSRDLGLKSGPVPGDIEKICGIGLAGIEKLSGLIRSSMKVCVVYNPASLEGNAVHALKALLSAVRQVPTIECGAMPSAPGTNSVGAMDMGVLPDFYPGGVPLSDADAIKQAWGEKAPLERGWSALEMIEKARAGELKALVVYRSNPVVDFPGGKAIEEALKKLQLLVVHDMLETETARLAHYVLPSNGPACDEGTLTNIGGRVQYRRRGLVTQNPPDWKMISAMARELGDTATYKDSFAVTAEISAKVPAYAGIDKKSLRGEGKNRDPVSYVEGNRAPSAPLPARPEGGLRLRVSHYLFARDKILDASSPLAHRFKSGVAYLHPDDARALGVKNGDEAVVVSGSAAVRVAAEVADHCNPGAVVLPKVSDEQNVFSLMNGSGPVSWVRIKK